MIIVLEGPDCAGKTTLAQALVKASGGKAKYIHATRPEEQWPYATKILLKAMVYDRAGHDVILDRHWISDNVYNYIDPGRGRSGIHVRRMDSVLNRYGAFYVLAAPDPDLCLAEYKQKHVERKELYGAKFAGIHYVMQVYRALWTGTPVPGMGSPWDDEAGGAQYVDQLVFTQPFSQRWFSRNYDRFMVIDQRRWARDVWEIAQIETRWARELDPVRLLNDDEILNLSGSLLTCRALLVGERAAKPEGPCLWPFYSNKGSSAYLTRALHRALVPETDVALVNAYSPKTMSTNALEVAVEYLQRFRKRVPIVALGREAAHALEWIGCDDHVHLPHPQWARRFDHHGDYHLKLERAIYGAKRPERRGTLSHGPVGVQEDLSAAQVLR